MIGVSVNEDELEAATEFFELFKTPWEQVVSGRRYRVVLATNNKIDHICADVVILYGSDEHSYEQEVGVKHEQFVGPVRVEWRNESFPIYGKVSVFAVDRRQTVLQLQGKAVDYQRHYNGRIIWRIGYDLFDEIRHLLTEGQPAEHALTPTLELHIELLRHILIESKISFVEIPPRPAGHDFICCLTHDVDFFGIRRHRFDRTMAGFLYRSSLGSLFDLFRGRRSCTEVLKNWWFFCSLPLVFAGLLRDFWRPFEDYAKAEPGGRSTFFLVPFKGHPGVSPDGTANAWRATRYQINDVSNEVRDAVCLGSEIGLHGIDAWRDSDAGEREMREVTAITGAKTVGIRMHWLYFDANSPKRLEDAGFDYDSTCGYNEAVGYRAGTSQAFRPVGCTTLVELPMAIMDSALFSSDRLGLGPKEALERSRKIAADAKRFGGTVVVNWHDRSLAPERLLGRFYQNLLEVVGKGNRIWFAKCGEAVDWFRWRRSIQFYGILKESEGLISSYRISVPRWHNHGTFVRVYRPALSAHEPLDRVFDGTASIECVV